MERDITLTNHNSFWQISTHTLTWSVTYNCIFFFMCILISTHTLTWSVTPGKMYLKPHRHISTHTLTWSVTVLLHIHHKVRSHFNSHAHVERDITNCLDLLIFKDFNSHAHVERDESNQSIKFLATISTHTLTWSVTSSY